MVLTILYFLTALGVLQKNRRNKMFPRFIIVALGISMLTKTIFLMILNLKYGQIVFYKEDVPKLTWLVSFGLAIDLASIFPILFFCFFVLKARVMWSNSEVLIV